MLLSERETNAYSSVVRMARAPRRVAKQRFDLLSPPVLMGATYLGLFAMSAIDILINTDGRPRLRDEFRLYPGLSIPALLYLAGGYLLFVAGYYLRAGQLIARLFPIRSGHLRPSRIPILTVVMFCFTFTILAAYTYMLGYGRRLVTSEGGTGGFLDNLLLLGEMSLIPLALGLYYYWLAKKYSSDRAAASGREGGRPRVSKAFSFFIWRIMLPLQIALGIWIGTRTRVIGVLLIALAAYHYTYRRLRLSMFLGCGALLIVSVPVLGIIRDAMFSTSLENTHFTLENAWDSFMARSSALEGFTTAFENPDAVPPTDSLWLTLIGGAVPRFIWRDKPNTTFGHDFSVWLTGNKLAEGFTPALPGELMLSLGYAGGLAAMFGLGILWRVLYEATIGAGLGTGSGFIYFSILPSLTQVETGFVVQYSLVLRFVLVGLLVYWVASARVAPDTDRAAPPRPLRPNS